ncbi:uncharacterized protein JCM6883_005382 [Sporobolomyces salmoneus]|uniref:uncharacterized protein n=1 Tax=Sporobolomyces salmoneus TaxID=183962 RepID=UPI00317C6CD3
MDSVEGDIGVASFTDSRSRYSPPRRSATLPSPTSSTSVPSTAPTLRQSRTPSLPPTSKDLTRRLSFPDARLQDETLANLNRWIIGFVLVDFDVDTGPLCQNVDNNYPHFTLPTSVQKQLAFSSLPEGDIPPSLTSQGYSYSWRLPYPNEQELRKAEQEQRQPVLRLSKTSSDETTETDGAMYGYVWFSQEQNSSLRRNYSQRSLVLLTQYPHLSGLFSSVISILGPLHFLHAKQSGAKGGMVESACLNIASWPPYREGSTLELPLLGSVLNVEIPLPFQAQYPKVLPSIVVPARVPTPSSTKPPTPALSILTSTTTTPRILPATHPLTPLSVLLFSPRTPNPSPASSTNATLTPTSGGGGLSFTKLLLIWELLVLEEPLLVYVSDPKSGSELLCHLRNLIRPIPFKGDLKPYFHIHDPSFPILCGRPGSKPKLGLLLAATNPLVLKNCQKTWPHILRLDRSTTPTAMLSDLLFGSSTLSPVSASPKPAISPSIDRRKEFFGENTAKSASRSSSVASINRVKAKEGGHGGFDSRSSTSSTRSSSPASLAPAATSTSSARLPIPSTSPPKKSTIGTAGGSGSASESWWGLKSERKRHLKKDDQVCALIEQKFKEGDYLGCDEVIYKHFASLTEKLLSPISRYLLTTSPTSSPSYVFNCIFYTFCLRLTST